MEGEIMKIYKSKYYPINIKTKEVLNKPFKKDGDLFRWNYGYFFRNKKIPSEHKKPFSFRKNVISIKGLRIIKLLKQNKIKLVENW